MSLQDPIADMLTRIRNAQRRAHPQVQIPASLFKDRILQVMEEEGYIDGFSRGQGEAGHPELVVRLRYSQEGKPAIREIKRVSRPGLRNYVSHADIPQIYGGFGVAILSTSKGVMSSRRAIREGVGGELVCTLF